MFLLHFLILQTFPFLCKGFVVGTIPAPVDLGQLITNGPQGVVINSNGGSLAFLRVALSLLS